jgi:hypothetical protein
LARAEVDPSSPNEISGRGFRNENFNALQARVQELKGQGKSVAEADKLVTAEFTAKYPNWAAPVRISGAVKAFYAEL